MGIIVLWWLTYFKDYEDFVPRTKLAVNKHHKNDVIKNRYVSVKIKILLKVGGVIQFRK